MGVDPFAGFKRKEPDDFDQIIGSDHDKVRRAIAVFATGAAADVASGEQALGVCGKFKILVMDESIRDPDAITQRRILWKSSGLTDEQIRIAWRELAREFLRKLALHSPKFDEYAGGLNIATIIRMLEVVGYSYGRAGLAKEEMAYSYSESAEGKGLHAQVSRKLVEIIREDLQHAQRKIDKDRDSLSMVGEDDEKKYEARVLSPSAKYERVKEHAKILLVPALAFAMNSGDQEQVKAATALKQEIEVGQASFELEIAQMCFEDQKSTHVEVLKELATLKRQVELGFVTADSFSGHPAALALADRLRRLESDGKTAERDQILDTLEKYGLRNG